MDVNYIQKETQHGLSTVVVVSPQADNKPRLAINEAMDDNLPTDQTLSNFEPQWKYEKG